MNKQQRFVVIAGLIGLAILLHFLFVEWGSFDTFGPDQPIVSIFSYKKDMTAEINDWSGLSEETVKALDELVADKYPERLKPSKSVEPSQRVESRKHIFHYTFGAYPRVGNMIIASVFGILVPFIFLISAAFVFYGWESVKANGGES